MNKNPFVPTPSYSTPQPPLPPGPPPPPQPTQPDYSAWWASAAAQQAHTQQPSVPQYNPQWTPPQPARPAHEQNALYANYGYGSHPGQWQRQQHQAQQQQPGYQPQQQPFHAAPAAPQPPQAQPGYNPYQPAAGYPQSYVPQASVGPPSQPLTQPVFQPPTQPQQAFFNQHLQAQGQPQQPRLHHGLAQHLPPAKRQRFDGPNANRPNQQPPPSQPQFQPPPPPSAPGGPFTGPAGLRSNPPSGPSQMQMGNAGRGGGPGGRGGVQAGRGRGGSFANNRGGASGRGRGGGSGYLGGSPSVNRGGGSAGQPGGALRGHGSRNNFGAGSRRNAGGSFNTGYHRGSSFRNRDSGHSSNQNRSSGRHEGNGPASSGAFNKDSASSFSNVGKKDENRRTLTDFKIVGLSIPELGWAWGTIPHSPAKPEIKQEVTDLDSAVAVKDEVVDDKSALQTQSEPKLDISDHTASSAEIPPVLPVDVKPVAEALPVSTRYQPDINGANPPPSRMRIYFHTPVTPDDSRPIPHAASPSYEANRKGKRKKLEDDDGDLDEEGRAPPPPPQMSALHDDRSSIAASVAPSVAETASEGDWLMAAIVEDEVDAEAVANPHPEGGDHDGVRHEVGRKADDHDDDDLDDLDAEGEIETLMDGDHIDDDFDMVGGPEMVPAEPSVQDIHLEGSSTSNGLPPDGVISVPAISDGQGNGSQLVPDGTAGLSEAAASAAGPAAAADSTAASDGLSRVSSIDNANPNAANASESIDTQVQDSSNGKPKSLEAASAESTFLLIETQEATQMDEDAQVESNLVDGQDRAHGTDDSGHGEMRMETHDHLPEPPLSPSSNVHEEVAASAVKTEAKGTPIPSANRLSISYAGGNRRLVINAESVSSFKLFRHDGRIEVGINLVKDNEDSLKGVLVEGLSESKSYIPIPGILDSHKEPDDTVPPFSKLTLPAPVQLIVHLDTVRPLSEPKWAKSGDIQEWLKSMFGRMFWVAGDAAEGWEKKIQVVDPDPPPTIWTFLDGWANNSPVGSLNERQRFLKTHMTETDNVLEILLRLVRGERATPASHNPPQISAPSLSGALLTALTPGSSHASQQTHVSLAVLAIFRLTVEYAKKALGDEKGKAEAEDKVGDIIRCLPSHLIYKSLDGIFKEWKMEKKGR